MYCDKCGADNLDTAKYCRKCGESCDAEVETKVAVRDHALQEPDRVSELHSEVPLRDLGMDAAGIEGDEREIFSISPTLKFVKAGYVLAAFGALLLVAMTSAFLAQYVSIWLTVFIGLLLFLVPAYYHFMQKLVRYTLTESKLEIDSGLISRTTRHLPIRRIQDVTVVSSVPQRLLGFGSLVIDNASEEGGKVTLRNINNPKHYADILLKQMRRLDQ